MRGGYKKLDNLVMEMLKERIIDRPTASQLITMCNDFVFNEEELKTSKEFQNLIKTTSNYDGILIKFLLTKLGSNAENNSNICFNML